MNGLTETLAKLGPARLAAMLTVTLALVGFFGFVIVRVSQPTMAVLYADVPFSEVGAIVRELDARGLKYELRQDGQTILAPRSEIPKLRMELASKGLPSGGSVGYEIFDKGDAFSSTSFVQNINLLRALEGELARTIRTMGRVTGARVHLVMPERRVFERDREPPRASIALKLRGELEAAQVRAIRHLVASAVEGLKPERVSIVDEAGRLLADGAGDGDPGVAAQERQSALERRLKTQVEDIVASVVGQGRARVQVATELDLNRVQQTQESFDPESRVLRSTQTRSEASQSSDAREGQVSVGNELPGQQRGQTGAAARDNSNKTEEIANYDYTKTVRSETHESGRIKKLSVAVLVDGVYTRSANNNEVTYQPRPQEEIERITALVRTAIGFDRNRGDSVEVVNLRFAEPPRAAVIDEPTGFLASLQPTKEDIYRGVELLALAVASLIVMLAIVRPLVGRMLGPDTLRKKIAEATGGMIGGPDATAAIPTAPRPESAASKFIELAQVNGQVQARSLESIGEVVKANPQEALAVLRGMINGKA